MRYDRHSVIRVEDGIQLISSALIMGLKGRMPVNGIPVRLTSLRLQTFARKGTRCVGCDLTAMFFAVERGVKEQGYPHEKKPYHLNLWGIKDGVEILFTHDHILARSLGGKDRLSNTQTMCEKCNSKKSIIEREIVEGRRANASRYGLVG